MTDIPAHGCFGEKRPELLGRRSPIGILVIPDFGPVQSMERGGNLRQLRGDSDNRSCLPYMSAMSCPYEPNVSTL